MTKPVKNGDTVTLHYSGAFEDGTPFDSSYDRNEPMTVAVGTGQLIQGFEDALYEMVSGEKKTFTLPPEEAYGEKNPDAFTTIKRDLFPEGFEFAVDRTVPLMGPGGEPVLGLITELTEEEIIVDLNHPMAGRTLVFEVEVLSVNKEEQDET